MEQQGTSTPGGAADANPSPADSSKDTSRQHLAAEPDAKHANPGCGLSPQQTADKQPPQVAGGGAPITGVSSPRDGKPD
jgi:hypothetical protein